MAESDERTVFKISSKSIRRFISGLTIRENTMARKGLLGRLGVGIFLAALSVGALGYSDAFGGDKLIWFGGTDDAGKSWNTSNGNFWTNTVNNGQTISKPSATFEFGSTGNTKYVYVGNYSSITPTGIPIYVSGMQVTGDYTFEGGSISSYEGATSAVNLNITSGNVTFKNNVNFTHGISDNNSLIVSGGNTVFEQNALFGGGATISGGSTVTIHGAFQFDNKPVAITNNSTLEIASSIGKSNAVFTGDATGTITKFKTGTLELASASNAFQGLLNISAGNIKLVDYGSFGQATVYIGGSNKLILGNTLASDARVNVLSGTGDVEIDGDKNLVLGSSNNFKGAINKTGTGSGGLVIDGATTDVVTLQKSNSYEGMTTINSGTLKLKDAGSIVKSKGVEIDTDGKFDLSEVTGTERGVKYLNGSGEVILGNKTLVIANDASGDPLGEYSGKITNGSAGTQGGLTLTAKAATDEFALSGANDYAGETKINAGTLTLKNSNAISNSKNVNLASGSSILKLETGANIKKLNGAGEVQLVNGSNLTIKNSGLASGESLGTYAGNIKGDGGLKLDVANPDNNVLTLSATNDYTGKTEIENGTLTLGTSGTIANSSKVLVGSKGTLNVSAADKTIKGLSDVIKDDGARDGGGSVILGGTTLSVHNSTDTTNDMFSGVISGAGNLDVSLADNESSLILAGANSYSGETKVHKGALVLSGDGTVSKSSKVTLDAGTRLNIAQVREEATIKELVGSGTVETGTGDGTAKTLTLGTATATGFTGLITGNGNVAIGAVAVGANPGLTGNVTFGRKHEYKGETYINKDKLTLTNAEAIQQSSGVTMKSGTQLIVNTGDVTSINNLKSEAGSTIDIQGNSTLLVKGNGAETGVAEVNGDITDTSGTGNLTLDSAGTLALKGTNSYSGATTIKNGTLALYGATNINDTSVVNFENAGTLDLSNTTGNATLKKLNSTSADTALVMSGTAGTKVTVGDGTINPAGTFAGVISGKSDLVVNASSLVLKGDNTYTGETVVERGTLKLEDNGGLAGSSVVNLKGNSTTLDLSLAKENVELQKLVSSKTNSNVIVGADTTLTLKGDKTGTDLNVGDYSGVISGGGNLKLDATNGDAVFAIKQSTQHTGTTEIAKGTMKLESGKEIDSSSAVIIGTGGVLDMSAHGGTYLMDHSQLSSTGDVNASIIKLHNGANSTHLEIANARNDNSFAGKIEGSASTNLTIKNNSTLALAGTVNLVTSSGGGLTTRGTTDVKSGSALKLAHTTSLNSNVDVAGRLETSGGSITGNVLIRNNATFKNYSEAGETQTLKITGDFTSRANSHLDFNMAAEGTGVIVTNGMATVAAQDLKVDAGTSGNFILFKTDGETKLDASALLALADSQRFYTVTNSNGTKNVKGFLKVENGMVKLNLLSDSQYDQYWQGGNGVWNATNTNWSDADSTSGNSIWLNDTGAVANFTHGGGTIAVDGPQKFDTLFFNGGTYVFNENTSSLNDKLVFAPGAGGDPASIGLSNGSIVTINTKLEGGSINLDVTGGGKLTLSNGSNSWGDTFVDVVSSGSTTLELTDAGAAGNGDISLGGSGSSLELNFGGTGGSIFDNKITGAGKSVTVKSGNTVEFTNGYGVNDYHARTVIESGAQLVGGSGGALSQNSVHELQGNGRLSLNGNQTIAGLVGESEFSEAALGGHTLRVDQVNSGTDVFNGILSGSGTLIKDGVSGSQLTINHLDTSTYQGYFSAAAGKLNLIGNAPMDLRLTSSGVSGNNGIINVTNNASGEYNTIAIVGNGVNSFNGTLEVAKGNVLLDNFTNNVLSDTAVRLASGVGMTVTESQSLGSLALVGNTITLTKDSAGVLSTLNIVNHGGLTVNGTSTLRIDAEGFGDIDGKNFFDLLASNARDYLIGGTSIGNAAKSINVVDVNGRNLNDKHDSAIIQGGVNVGTAYIQGKVDSGSDGMGHDGIYLERMLTEIRSATDVTIDSSDTPSSGYAAMNITTPGQKNMSAILSGNSFTFAGDESIYVTNANNSYSGNTTVNMDSGKEVVLMHKNAFGNTKLVDIKGGGVNINGYKVEFDALTGLADTKLDLGTSGGSITLRNPTVSNAEYVYAGNVSGVGDIVKTGAGTQIFSGNNTLAGNITVNGGKLAWAGTLGAYGSKKASVTVGPNAEFAQRGSTINGNVNVAGVGSAISGYGDIYGNLNINNFGTYIVSADKGDIDKTYVSGKTTFGNGSGIVFNNDALGYMYMNPYRQLDILSSGNGFDLTNSSWKNGVIQVNMGILGTANLRVQGNTLSYTDLTRPVGGPGQIIAQSWGTQGIGVSDIMEHSNLGQVVNHNVLRFIGQDRSLIDSNASLNARFANAKFIGMGPWALGDLPYSPAEVLSVFNYESGLNATQSVDAMLDTSRTMLGQGVQNRVNSLRAARTILTSAATMPQAATGYAQSELAYSSLMVGEGYIMADGSVSPTFCPPGTAAQQPIGYGYGPDYSTNRVWASAIGSWNKYDTSSGGIAGYSYDAGGIMVGVDRSVGDFVFGAALAYTHGTLEDKLALSSSSKVDSYSVNLYGDYNHESGINVMGFGGFEWFDHDVSRTVAGYRDYNGVLSRDYGSESADYHGTGWYLGANVSYDFLPMDNLTVTPSIGLTYADARTKSFDRTTVRSSGAVLLDSFSSVKKHSISLPIDVAATYDVIIERDRKLSVLGNVGYAYEFHNKGAKGSYNWLDTAGSPAISFTGRDPGRSTWNFGIGARYQKKNVDFDVKYDFVHRKDLKNHRLSASVGLEF